MVFERIYSSEQTKEIWIYGLDNDDIFEVGGKGDKEIKIRLIGGQNHDEYYIENGKNLVIYDYKSKKKSNSKHGMNSCYSQKRNMLLSSDNILKLMNNM